MVKIKRATTTKTPSKVKRYICYCLRSTSTKRRTYVGITNNFKRRIRQHNGEITGGAKYTHAYRPWAPFFRVHGFKTKRQVLRFEWAMKHRKRSRKGASPAEIRCLTLEYLLRAPKKESTADMIHGLSGSLRVEVLTSKHMYIKMLGVDVERFKVNCTKRPTTIAYTFIK